MTGTEEEGGEGRRLSSLFPIVTFLLSLSLSHFFHNLKHECLTVYGEKGWLYHTSKPFTLVDVCLFVFVLVCVGVCVK